MCGIAGQYSRDAPPAEAGVRAAVEAIRHRGPDHQGIWSADHIALGHARLSIIDLSAAADQPMLADQVPVALVYNGEIYNFRELRRELEALGATFRTRSDTEVVLAAYLRWGPGAFARFSGMFAFALWDGRNRTLYLARDRFGIKPLYYREDDGTLSFGSEIKALLAMTPGELRRLNPQGFHEFLWFGNPLGPETMFSGIRRLPPGSYLEVKHGSSELTRFWEPTAVAVVTDDFETAVEEVRERLRHAVESHLVSDVPVGLFLSGGVDSSAIAAYASRAYAGRLSTFSVAFDFEGDGELPHARAVASHFGTDHHEVRITAPDIQALLPLMVRCHDEPFADAANIPLYLLTRELRGAIKVVLQGDGGDEVFAGYRRYELLGLPVPWGTLRSVGGRLVPRGINLPDMPRRVLRMVEALGAPPEEQTSLLLTVESERARPEQLLGEVGLALVAATDPFRRYREVTRRLAGIDPVRRMLLTDLSILLPDTFLEKVDRATMANSIEVRVPFLDARLTDYAVALPSRYKVRWGAKKRLLREALRGVVPESILDRPKTGFGVPYQRWLRTTLQNYVRSVLMESRATRETVLDRTALERLVSEHASGRRDRGFLLWKALNLALWWDLYEMTV